MPAFSLSLLDPFLTSAAFATLMAFSLLPARASEAVQPTPHQALDLSAVTNWTYQLQDISIDRLGGDLIVIDHSRDGTAQGAFSAAETAALKAGPEGQRRIVLAYLSIGEAESYRAYWQNEWLVSPPRWLKAENPEWKGNYPVQFWDAQWQSLIFGGADAYLDSILQAGFDGVYLDRVDTYEVADDTLPRAKRRTAMVNFVATLAAYARARRPGFLVVAQNGEELLKLPQYRAIIDAIAKEDLFYGLRGDDTPNPRQAIADSLRHIAALQATGKPAFLVEYVSRPDHIRVVGEMAASHGMPLFIGARELDSPSSLTDR